MNDEIYKFLELEDGNTAKDLTIIRKILEINKYFSISDIQTFVREHYNKYKNSHMNLVSNLNKNEKQPKCEEVISIIDIFLETELCDDLIPLFDGDFFLNINVVKFYLNNFNCFSISKFIESTFYKEIICKNHEIEEEKNTMDSDLGFKNKINDENENKNLQTKSLKNNEDNNTIKSKISDKNNEYTEDISTFNKNTELKSLIEKLIVMIVNENYDYMCQKKLIEYLPVETYSEIILNEHTFTHILKKSVDVLKIMIYELKNPKEVKELEIKISKDDTFRKNAIRYIKTQECINTTILISAIIINNYFPKMLFSSGEENNLTIKNIDLKKILFLVDYSYILNFNNEFFKRQLMVHLLELNFNLELFFYSITATTEIKYEMVKHIENLEFTPKEIFILYFIEKVNLKNERKEISLENEISEIIKYEIYDHEVLEYILLNDLDYGIFNYDCLKMLCNNGLKYKKLENKLIEKYFRRITKYNLNIENVLFQSYKRVNDFLSLYYDTYKDIRINNQKMFSDHKDLLEEITQFDHIEGQTNFEKNISRDDNEEFIKSCIHLTKDKKTDLPILDKYTNFNEDEIEFMIRVYIFQSKNLNEITFILLFLYQKKYSVSDDIEKYFIDNINKITDPINKVIFISNVYSKIKNYIQIISESIKLISKTKREEVLKQIKNLYPLRYCFYDSSNDLVSVSSGMVSLFYETVEDHFEILEEIRNLDDINLRFLKNYFHFFLSDVITTHKYDTSIVCEHINNITYNLVNKDVLKSSKNLHKNENNFSDQKNTNIVKKQKLNECFRNKVKTDNVVIRDIILICAKFYLSKIIHNNDFLQEKEIQLATNFLNIMYLYMQKTGKEIAVYKKCEDFIRCLHNSTSLLDLNIIVKNIKSLK